MPLAGKQTGPQGVEPGGGWRQRGPWRGCEWVAVGCRGKIRGWEVLGEQGGIGVKEMLTDTINVICLLPQEVDGSLFCPFVPPRSPLLLSTG